MLTLQFWLFELDGGQGKLAVEEELVQIACARQLFLEGLRHHKDHLGLYTNYFCLELQNMCAVSRLDVPEDDSAQANIKNGQIAKILMKEMLENIPNDFVDKAILELIPSIPTPQIQRELVDEYLSLRGNSAKAWDFVARSHLANGLSRLEEKTFLDRVEACCFAYNKALEVVPTTGLFDYYLTTLQQIKAQLGQANNREGHFITVKVLELFEKGQQSNLLSEKHKSFFADLLL